MKNLFIYCLVIGTQFLINIKTQPGYIHPDEFFQTVEISAGEVLSYDIFKAWEYNSDHPIRSQAINELFLNIPLKLFIKLMEMFNTNSQSIDILLFFRIWTSFCSLINIYCVYLLSCNRKLSLILLGTSYISLVFYSRTFSNCWETQVLSLFLITFQWRWCRRIEILQGAIVCLGVFCRPTFVIFAIPFIVQKLIKQSLWEIIRYAAHGTIGFLSLAICLISIDTVKYRYNELQFTGALGTDLREFISKLVVIPVNFVAYNSQSDNLKSHGHHPFFTHLLVNLPLMLGPLFLVFASSLLYVRKSSQIRQLFLAIIFPVAFLSLFPHQEMRFLLPLFPLLIVLISAILNHSLKKNDHGIISAIIIGHVIFSFTMTLFWGYFHEAGIVPATKMIAHDIESTPRTHCHIILSYKTLLMPTFPFKRTHSNVCKAAVINLMGIEEQLFFDKVDQIKAELTQKSLPTMLHLIYPGAYVFRNSQRLESLGRVSAYKVIQWHINTDLWHTNASLYDFVSLKYIKFVL